MFYLFILGRDHELSKIEIESLLESKNIEYKVMDESREVIVIETKYLDPKIIEEFGGIIKIAKVISNTNKHYEIEENLEKANLYEGNKNKIEYCVDGFSTNLLSFVVDFLKDYFKNIKLKALHSKTNEPSKLINKRILEEGLDLVIFKNFIGKTIAVSNPLEFKKRDLARPEVDYMKVISIRLAKILVNISKVKKNQTLLDPFCGAATVLQEALLKGINVIGLDTDIESVKQAEKNLQWLVKEYNIKNSYKLLNIDCTKLNNIKENSIDGLVTEPYMGPYIRKLPTIPQAKELVLELSDLYNELLKNIKNVLKKNSRVVIIIPKFRTRENKKVFLEFRSIAESNNFSVIFKPINYGYKESKLLREIYILEKN